MMQCPSCGESNRLGAIFCKSCGAKLEIDSITAQTFEQATGVVAKDKADAKHRVRRIIVNVLRLAFLGAIIFGIYLALQRPEVDQPETSGKDATAFKAKLQKISNAIEAKRTGNVTVSEQKLNSYIRSLVNATESNSKYQLVDSWVLIEDDGKLDWVIEATLFGRPLRLQYFGTIKIKDDEVAFIPEGFFSAQFGKLPYPTPLIKLMTARLWKSILEGNEGQNKRILAAISDLKFEGDDITVTIKP